ncbi:MAG: YbjN domain-containing protein [Promicromonosporaceae bacterium]|nr:YbjN domain-containing protein [Promicromonosporaceae bacterium]
MWRKANTQPGSQNQPITRDRVEAVMKAHDWKYFIDSDGVLGGRWESSDVYFNLLTLFGDTPDGLQVRAYWRRELPAAAEVAAATVANRWNRDKLFPKVYVSVDRGTLTVRAEGNFPLRHGVADDQLDDFVNSTITTAIQAFELFGSHFSESALSDGAL